MHVGGRPATTRATGWVTAIALAVCAAACSGATDRPANSDREQSSPHEIIVFAAASLTSALSDIADEFTARHPETTVTFNFASSSRLAVQIVEGAPVDVFASADTDSMDRLGDVVDPVVFATNRAAIAVAAGNPLGVSGLDNLSDTDLVVVTCAPEAPCGRYAAEVFASADISPSVDSYESNVNGVMAKIAFGEADAGIVYHSDVVRGVGSISGVTIPDPVNIVARYPVAVPSTAANPAGGAEFVEFVLGDIGASVLRDAGFGPP